jgi:hypothetical protein
MNLRFKPMSLSRNIIPDRVALRAYTRWTKGPGGCYISTYSVASHGYAQIGWTEGDHHSGTTAHRAAWVHIYGQIPDEMTVDHKPPTCDRRCVNVDHLRLLTNFENARRTSGRDWPVGTCVNGHDNSELVRWGGKLKCRQCSLQWDRKYRAQNRDRYNARQREYRALNRDRILANQRRYRRTKRDAVTTK